MYTNIAPRIGASKNQTKILTRSPAIRGAMQQMLIDHQLGKHKKKPANME